MHGHRHAKESRFPHKVCVRVCVRACVRVCSTVQVTTTDALVSFFLKLDLDKSLHRPTEI